MQLLYEDWAYVQKFEGIYIVSNRGRVACMSRFIPVTGQSDRFIKGRILKLKKNNKGYVHVCLHRCLDIYGTYVHILVSKAFLPTLDSKVWVNHKDGIRWNNSVFNLEWSTISENHLHAYDKLGRINPAAKAIEMLNLLGIVIGEFSSSAEAARYLNKDSSTIAEIVRGKRKSLRNGYSFRLLVKKVE